MKGYKVFIFLGNREYSSELMRSIAEQYAFDNHDKRPLLIEVHEHGGWWLQYGVISKELIVIGSANEQAFYNGQARAMREQFSKMDLESLPEIRRA